MLNGQNFVPSNLGETAQSWLGDLKYRETIIVSTLPGSDYRRRLTDILSNPRFLQQHSQLHIANTLLLDYSLSQWKCPLDLQTELDHHLDRNGNNLLVFLGFEEILKAGRLDLLKLIDTYHRERGIYVLIFLAGNYYSVSNQTLVEQLPNFQPKLIYYGLSSMDIVAQYASSVAKHWNINLDDTKLKSLVKETGPLKRLVKTLLWEMRNSPEATNLSAFKSPSYHQQIRSFWKSFTKEEQEVLTKIIYQKTLSETQALTLLWLERVGVVNQGQIVIPDLANYIGNYLGDPEMIRVVDDQIYLGTASIKNSLTPKQRLIIRKLLQTPSIWTTREELIESLWGNNSTDVNDWALDSQISRLRSRLRDLNLDTHLLVQRGKGVMWRP